MVVSQTPILSRHMHTKLIALISTQIGIRSRPLHFIALTDLLPWVGVNIVMMASFLYMLLQFIEHTLLRYAPFPIRSEANADSLRSNKGNSIVFF